MINEDVVPLPVEGFVGCDIERDVKFAVAHAGPIIGSRGNFHGVLLALVDEGFFAALARAREDVLRIGRLFTETIKAAFQQSRK